MRKTFLYSALFVGGGIFGWAVDTGYRSMIARYFAPGTLVPFFSIIFAIGAVMLFIFFRFGKMSFLKSVVMGTILCVALELVGGIISVSLLHIRLWDYSSNPFNFYGFIDMKHAFYWFILTALYRLFYRVI